MSFWDDLIGVESFSQPADYRVRVVSVRVIDRGLYARLAEKSHRLSILFVIEFAQMLRIGSVTDLTTATEQLRRWRCGRIVMRAGRLVEIQHRLTAGNVSVAQVWWQAKFGRMEDDVCWLDYHQPFGMPSFLTLDYVRSGDRSGYKTFVGACHVLDEIARIRGAVAIVAHVSNQSISDRLLERLGWQRHLTQWSGRHWIRRFYDGYPVSAVCRYLGS